MARRLQALLRGFLTTAAPALLLVGCAAETPDYQSLLPSSSAPTTTERPVPIARYLEQRDVVGLPLTPKTLTELTVTMPQPPGWAKVEDPERPAAFEIIRKTDVDTYQPTATLMVFKLMGKFDAEEAIKHGYADAELSDRFVRLNASMADFNGMPSAMIEGAYNVGEQRRQTYNRIVLPTGPPPIDQHYLVQFTVTTAADQAEDHSKDVLAIIEGFNVEVK